MFVQAADGQRQAQEERGDGRGQVQQDAEQRGVDGREDGGED
jgi:hypothetical protein